LNKTRHSHFTVLLWGLCSRWWKSGSWRMEWGRNLLSSTLKMEAAGSFEALVNTSTISRLKSSDQHVNTDRQKYIKSHIKLCSILHMLLLSNQQE